MPNPDAGNLPSKLGNTPSKFNRRASATEPPVNERTASWGGLPGKSGPGRSNGVPKLEIYAKSDGI